MDVKAVFEGLAANARTITGLRSFAFAPDAITPPTFFCLDLEITYDVTFGGDDEFDPVTCRLLVSKATDKQGQQLLQQFISRSGPKSIKAALESNRSLGGACEDLHVKRATGYGRYEHNGTEYLGADFLVHVIG